MLRLWIGAVVSLSALVQAEEWKAKVRTLAIRKGELPTWHLQTGDGEFQELDWPVTQPCDVFQAMADKELLLLSKGTDKDGKATFTTARKGPVPAGAEEILLLATPAAEGEEAKVNALSKRDDEMRIFYSTFWGTRKNQRSLVIIQDEDHRVRLHRIVDILQKAEAP